MKKALLILAYLLIISTLSFSQSLTLVPTNPISPSKGTMNYDNINNVLQYWNGSSWIPITNAASGTGWTLNGSNIYNNNAGNVGIGTNSPKAPLNIVGLANATTLYQTPDTGFGINQGLMVGKITNSFNKNAYLWNYDTSDLIFGVNATEAMRILANQKIGINNNSPQYQLDILSTSPKGFRVKSQNGDFADVTVESYNADASISLFNAASNAKWLVLNDAGGDNFMIRELLQPTESFKIQHNSGNITMSHHLNVVGTLSKGAGSFKIDHPLDPENKYLYHSFVESPDMMNIYNGNNITDNQGKAIVKLPSYFEALNMDFRYQLTVIGATFSQAIISKEVEENAFEISTNAPNVKVSWQVTGIRHDSFANENRIPTEVNKDMKEKGKYLHPEAFKLPISKSISSKD